MLLALLEDPPPALCAVQARLAALYPEWRLCAMPAAGLQADGGEGADEPPLSSFVANAVMPGDPCMCAPPRAASLPCSCSPRAPRQRLPPPPPGCLAPLA